MSFSHDLTIALIEFGLENDVSNFTIAYALDVLLKCVFVLLGILYFLTSKPGLKVLKKLSKYY